MPISNIALFIDYENIHISLERQYHIIPDPNKLAALLTEEVKKRGKIVIGQAYADWEEYEGVQPALKKQGIDPRYVLSKKTVKGDEKGQVTISRKNSSDIALALDASEVLHTRDDIDTFVVVSGDRDFIELVSKLHNRNKCVIIFGVEKTTSHELVDSSDEFITIEKLFGITPSPKAGAELLHEEEEIDFDALIGKIDELQKCHSYLGLKFLDQKLLPGQADLITKAIDMGILIKYRMPNPGNPSGFQTSACKLNEENPEVKRVLKLPKNTP